MSDLSEVTFSKSHNVSVVELSATPGAERCMAGHGSLTDVLVVYVRADKFSSAASAGVGEGGSGMQDDWQNDLSVPLPNHGAAIERLELCSTTLPFLAGDEHPVKCSPWLLLPHLEGFTLPYSNVDVL